MKIMGINLLSEDCQLSVEIYSSIFGGKILVTGEFHSELEIESGYRIFFSPNSKKCKVGVGSFSVQGKPSPSFLESSFFVPEQSFIDKGYLSYLDRYGNRIWFLIDT
jgi:hypothetical protein